MLKSTIRSLLKYLGIVAFKRSSRVYIPSDETYGIVASLVNRSNPCIIDGGAHRGDAVDVLSALLPQATFHCFEPDPMLGAELEVHFAGNDKTKVVRVALGDALGTATFNINASRPTNSLLPSGEVLQADLQALCRTVEQVEVEVTTIDDYCRKNNVNRVDIIKLDLQGYDYLALKGAEQTLRQARVVLVEVLFREIYKGCHLFPDILNFMMTQGYELYTLSELHYGERDELLWADAIFLNRAVD